MHKSRSKNFLMGIGGDSGSGKSTIVNEIIEKIGPEKISVLHHDAYYRHRPELTFEERTKINFDHPDSLETGLLVEHLSSQFPERMLKLSFIILHGICGIQNQKR